MEARKFKRTFHGQRETMLRGASEVDLLFNHTTTLILGSPSHPLITPSITEGQLQGQDDINAVFAMSVIRITS